MPADGCRPRLGVCQLGAARIAVLGQRRSLMAMRARPHLGARVRSGCSVRGQARWLRFSRVLAGGEPGLSEELRGWRASGGQDVSGDEIVFVLEQADKRQAGQGHPGCLQIAGKAGPLAVAGCDGFSRVRPEP